MFLSLEFTSIGRRNVISKLLLGKTDLERLVSPHLKERLFDRLFVVDRLQAFVDRLTFDRCRLYSMPILPLISD